MRPDEIFELKHDAVAVGTVPSTHMVLLVGYEYRDGLAYLVFMNSNGKSFADEGFGRMPAAPPPHQHHRLDDLCTKMPARCIDDHRAALISVGATD
ncbi:hypothetical protein E2562_031628 [Oryza meyeriana var. granulata]|uniref:Peptidase C1A papain C-terminal domain-containing protein n=1 Tax=Oryza meyeriana var. granulata TaxID=110450 RepID=A0A6G1DAG1_9ORYZ|nr:hypothetical protein E2562_031628 [Oryza meyeriana var. granulata]